MEETNYGSIDSDPDKVKSIIAGGSLKIFRILNSALRSTGSLFVVIFGRSTFLRENIANIFWALKRVRASESMRLAQIPHQLS